MGRLGVAHGRGGTGLHLFLEQVLAGKDGVLVLAELGALDDGDAALEALRDDLAAWHLAHTHIALAVREDHDVAGEEWAVRASKV